MYVLDKHVHALNFLTISTDRSNFPEHVRVWRLILEKIIMDLWDVLKYTIIYWYADTKRMSRPNVVTSKFKKTLHSSYLEST